MQPAEGMYQGAWLVHAHGQQLEKLQMHNKQHKQSTWPPNNENTW